MGNHHSKEFKESIVQKSLLPGGESLTELSRSSGISRRSIGRWRKQFQSHIFKDIDGTKLPKDWERSEKVSAVFEAGKLEGKELGRWLRSNGLESGHIELWKREIMDTPKSDKKQKELTAAKKRIKELEADLRRKDKALAEAAALLILKKKADLIWGEEDD